MSRKSRSALSRAEARKIMARDVAQPLEIFETALELLSRIEHRSSLPTTMPGPALPSLLARCETIVKKADADDARHRLLICDDGLDVLTTAWWQRHAGNIGVQRMPAATDSSMLEAVVSAFERGEARRGRQTLTLASLDEGLAGPRIFSDRRLLVWHPWASFVSAPRGGTLDAHCLRTMRVLDRYEGISVLRLEDFGTTPADQAAGLAAEFGMSPVSRRRSSTDFPDRLRPPQEIDGGAAYQQLCARLGYLPNHVPLPPLKAPQPQRRHGSWQDLPQSPTEPARVSWFLPRLAALKPSSVDADTGRLADLTAVLDKTLAEADPRAALDTVVDTMPPADAALLLLLGAAHGARVGDKLLSLGLVSEAMDLTSHTMLDLRQLGASLYAELGYPQHALHLTAGALVEPGFLDEDARRRVLKTLYGEALRPGGEHGQDLLIAHLRAHWPDPVEGRRRRLVEIGTTREAVPGQGSTKQLAALCDELGMDFVTVDMDPQNGRRAQRMFHRNEQTFLAVSRKGEEYLAQTDGPLDYVFLDAYDFDHGNHSEWRQSRYTQFLGDRISDAACHQMHLECAQALVEKLAPDGLICFDDTWLDDAGKWTAKGKTAMPYLLERGFEVIEARNRAALLRRKHSD